MLVEGGGPRACLNGADAVGPELVAAQQRSVADPRVGGGAHASRDRVAVRRIGEAACRRPDRRAGRRILLPAGVPSPLDLAGGGIQQQAPAERGLRRVAGHREDAPEQECARQRRRGLGCAVRPVIRRPVLQPAVPLATAGRGCEVVGGDALAPHLRGRSALDVGVGHQQPPRCRLPREAPDIGVAVRLSGTAVERRQVGNARQQRRHRAAGRSEGPHDPGRAADQYHAGHAAHPAVRAGQSPADQV